MAKNKASISVTELDFDKIKEQLITYLSADPTFSDYNFEGSALNILLDILSLNTHMNAVIANMSANEMFVDSAQLRQNIVSLAKLIGYTPRSIRASMGIISLEFQNVPNAPAYITMPAGTRFTTIQEITFSTKETILIYPSAPGVYSKIGIDIFEGHLNSYHYTVDSNSDQKYIIPSVNADMSTLNVFVTENNITTKYKLNENITLLTPDSAVYFIHENPDGFFEVTFGDGILGKKLINGAKIKLNFIVSNHLDEANGINVFNSFHPIDNISSYTITTDSKSFGGAGKESQEDIAFRSPGMWRAQSRALITKDYENFLLKEYPWIESMSVWGGEYNNPPVYGKVFFALKPKHTDFLSGNLKAKVKSELIKKYNVVTIQPEIVNHEFIYILVNTTVQYNNIMTTLDEGSIKNTIIQNILNFSINNLQKFHVPFYISKLTKIIDESDVSIVSSLTDIQLMKKYIPSLGIPQVLNFEFNNELEPGTFYSSFFNTNTSLSPIKQAIYDDGLGTLYTKSAIGSVINPNIGSIDYTTGAVNFDIVIYNVPTDTNDLRIYCTPKKQNIIPGFKQILIIDSSARITEYQRNQGIDVTLSVETSEYK